MKTVGEDFPSSVRVGTPNASSRAGSVAATSYINPERLMDDLTILYAARDRVMLSLTALDCAAMAAGTPIRSTSARERFVDLGTRLREVDEIARKAWQDELAAAGGYEPALRPILVKAGQSDARGLKTLVRKDGNHVDATEYDELLAVLEGAIVKAREAGIDDYAASLFAHLDEKTLKILVDDAPSLRYFHADNKELVERLGDVLAQLRGLFAVVVKHPDLETQYPELWKRFETMNPTTILNLLQTGKGWDPDGPLLTGVNTKLLVKIADQVLSPAKRNPTDPDFATATFWRKPMALRLLREDQLSGGKAFSLYLSSPEYNARGFETVSRRLEELVLSSELAVAGAITQKADEDLALRAALLKTHFTNAFDRGSKAEVLQATSLVEFVIATTTSSRSLSKSMKAALAVGLAGMMTHPETRDDLLVCARGGSGTGQTALQDAKVSWNTPTLDIDGNRLRKFIQCLADEPNAVKIIAAAIGPTIASTACAAQGLPSGARLPEGIGFIYGSMLSKFDADTQAKRAFFDGLGLGLTVLFATAGGLATGPGGGMALGALGSGVLQNITALVDVEPKNKLGLPMTDEGMREYFQCTYVMASYKWLSADTKSEVLKSLSTKVELPEIRPVLSNVKDMLQIANQGMLSSADLQRVSNLIFKGSMKETNGLQTADQVTINKFFNTASEAAEQARKGVK
jgi:hypothetical protein